MNASLLESLERHAADRPGKLAVREVSARGAHRELCWSELWGAVSQRAKDLDARASGASRSEPVVLQSSAGIDVLIGLLGGLSAGRAVLPLPEAMPEAETRKLLGRVRRTDVAPPDGSLLLCSSGTTGRPKIVRRRLPALDALARACVERIGVDAGDMFLVPIPLHHSYGIDMGVLTALSAGASVEIHAHFQGAAVLAALSERPITVLPAVPVIFDGLVRLARRAPPSHVLRRVISAGSPLPLRIHEGFEEIFGTKIGQIYGATEFGSLTYNDPDRSGFDPCSVGWPMGDGEVRILELEAPAVDRPLPVPDEGQLAVRASSLLSEYVDDPEPATRDGFFLPGDLGRCRRDGSIELTGRLKLLIDIGSVKVNPFEVEDVLGRHPGVREAVVVGVRVSDTVSRLKAVVVPEPGAEPDAAELREFTRQRLIHYKVPRSFEIRSDVPRSPTGKILRQALGADVRGGLSSS